MKNPTGRIVSFVDGAAGVSAVVDVDIEAACPRCAAGKGCGAGLYGARSGKRQVEASLLPGLNVAEGDVVEIALASDNLLQAAFIVYGLPLLGALAAAALAFGFSLGDAAAAVAALAGLALGLLAGRWRLRQTACLRRFVPTVEKRLNDEPVQ